MAAVVIAGRELNRQVEHAELLVDRHLGPDAAVARVRGGIALPRIGAELTSARNRVEDPEPLAGSNVETPDVSLLVVLALGRPARQVRGADDDDVLRDDRRGMQANLTRLEIDRLVVVELQIDDAVAAEAG